MTESEFWGRLEYSISHQLEVMAKGREHYLWCDGIGPGEFYLMDARPRITGRACIVHDQEKYETWGYTLLLPQQYESRDEIDWAALLPSDDRGHWVSVDMSNRHITLDLASGLSDDPRVVPGG